MAGGGKAKIKSRDLIGSGEVNRKRDMQNEIGERQAIVVGRGPVWLTLIEEIRPFRIIKTCWPLFYCLKNNVW